MSLPVGDYCLVPSTFHPQVEGEFLVRLWVDSRWQSSLDSRTGRRIADHQVNLQIFLLPFKLQQLSLYLSRLNILICPQKN